MNLEESSNTCGGLGILEIPSSIVNTFFLSILSSCFKLINSAFIISTVTPVVSLPWQEIHFSCFSSYHRASFHLQLNGFYKLFLRADLNLKNKQTTSWE